MNKTPSVCGEPPVLPNCHRSLRIPTSLILTHFWVTQSAVNLTNYQNSFFYFNRQLLKISLAQASLWNTEDLETSKQCSLLKELRSGQGKISRLHKLPSVAWKWAWLICTSQMPGDKPREYEQPAVRSGGALLLSASLPSPSSASAVPVSFANLIK